MPRTKLTILVSGMIAADAHQGGATWAVLQYVLGLRNLGHRVLFVEPMDPGRVEPSGVTFHDSVSARYFRQVVSDFGLTDWSALLSVGSRTTVGLDYMRCLDIARQADLLINISGMLTDEALISHIPIRVYLDLDPAFIQIWEAQGTDMRFGGHTHFVTIGQAIGQPDCPVPTGGRTWIKTLQPVVLAHWPPAERVEHPAFTTVGNWRSYGSIEHEGVFYGQKAHSLRQFIALPRKSSARFLLAMAIHASEERDLAALSEHGWQRVEPSTVAATPAAYQQFVQGSLGELGIAKSGYVASRCGWFSDRSAVYLASGRPVIAQDTAFARFLPTGRGLFSFATMDDLLTALDEVQSDYARHSAAARELAVEFFDSDKVLTRLLASVGAA